MGFLWGHLCHDLVTGRHTLSRSPGGPGAGPTAVLPPFVHAAALPGPAELARPGTVVLSMTLCRPEQLGLSWPQVRRPSHSEWFNGSQWLPDPAESVRLGLPGRCHDTVMMIVVSEPP